MPVCGPLVNSNSMPLPLLTPSWVSSLNIGALVSCMISAARSTEVFSNGIFCHSGCHVLYFPSVYFMHMVINGHANSGITLGRGMSGGSRMVRVVSIYGVTFDVSFQSCVSQDIIVGCSSWISRLST